MELTRKQLHDIANRRLKQIQLLLVENKQLKDELERYRATPEPPQYAPHPDILIKRHLPGYVVDNSFFTS